MQSRRRLELDRDLIVSLKKKRDDLAVLIEWAEAGEPVDAEFSQALEAFEQQVQAVLGVAPATAAEIVQAFDEVVASGESVEEEGPRPRQAQPDDLYGARDDNSR